MAVVQLLTASSEGNEDYASNAARQTANALKEFSVAVRGVAATSNNRDLQNKIIDRAQLVMAKSARLVMEAQRTMATPSNRTARVRILLLYNEKKINYINKHGFFRKVCQMLAKMSVGHCP